MAGVDELGNEVEVSEAGHSAIATENMVDRVGEAKISDAKTKEVVSEAGYSPIEAKNIDGYEENTSIEEEQRLRRKEVRACRIGVNCIVDGIAVDGLLGFDLLDKDYNVVIDEKLEASSKDYGEENDAPSELYIDYEDNDDNIFELALIHDEVYTAAPKSSREKDILESSNSFDPIYTIDHNEENLKEFNESIENNDDLHSVKSSGDEDEIFLKFNEANGFNDP
ncbi:conserved hypothetical protein [Ricinus communis]|uniref:Uncharacterized protein n=1 Tax=Ricinus communis TaxID=3988 RepID=B9SXF9_RICCO|nr:conserved hypothetical protein [Ricinus communis]